MRTLIKAEAAFHFQSTIPSYWILAYLVGEQEIVCQLCTLLILMKISYIFQLFCFLSLWNSYPGFVQWLFEISVPKHMILKLPRHILFYQKIYLTVNIYVRKRIFLPAASIC